MSNSNGGAGTPGAGLSKYQEALKRLKGEPEQAAPDFVDDPPAPEAAATPGSDAIPEAAEDGVLSFLDDIAAEHGLTEAPAPAAEAAPPPSEAEISANKAPPAEEKSAAKKSDDSMDAYLQSLNKLKAEKGASGASGAQDEAAEDEPQSPADALKAARGMMQDSGETGDQVDRRYQQATERLKQRSSVQEAAQKKPRRVPALRGVLHTEDDRAPCAPAAGGRKARSKANPKAAAAGGSRLTELPPAAVKAGVGVALLVAGLLLQLGVYLLLDTPFLARDLLAGVCAMLPVGLVIALVTPETDRDWRAVIGGVAALGLTASLAFALALATSHSASLAGAHIVVVVFLQLGILTMLLGPVILAVAAWLHRLELITLTDPLYG